MTGILILDEPHWPPVYAAARGFFEGREVKLDRLSFEEKKGLGFPVC